VCERDRTERKQISLIKVRVKVKQYNYRPGQVLKVPEG